MTRTQATRSNLSLALIDSSSSSSTRTKRAIINYANICCQLRIYLSLVAQNLGDDLGARSASVGVLCRRAFARARSQRCASNGPYYICNLVAIAVFILTPKHQRQRWLYPSIDHKLNFRPDTRTKSKLEPETPLQVRPIRFDSSRDDVCHEDNRLILQHLLACYR